MPEHELAFTGIAEAGALLRAGKVSSVELTEAAIAQAERLQPTLNAFITETHEQARDAARRADADFAAGIDRGPLQGIPVALKDLCATNGVRTTAGSAVLADWVPDFDATVVRKLAEGGAVSLGKLNLHEFAYGVTSANEHFGVVRNPWDTERIPGGSSGGSGSAVAAGICAGAIGSDTGGSIRIPAALCGITGLMPTYGRVSRAGVVPLSWSLDHVGPLTRSVEDAALFLNAIAGFDPADGSSLDEPWFDAAEGIGAPVEGLRVGVVRQQFELADDDVRQAAEGALKELESLGMRLHEVELPLLMQARALPILGIEAAAYHAEWLRARPEDYSDEVRTLLLWGATFSGVDYVNALRVRREFTEQVEAAMREVDVLVMPTCPSVASRITEIESGVARFAGLTAPWDHTGQPVLSVPCGFGDGGMPVGLSFAGRPFEEALIGRAGHAYQQATDWHLQRPAMAVSS